MKTLDEVIKNFEICRKARLNLISCDGCTYADENNAQCIACNEVDVLLYLRGYKEDRNDLTALRAYWAEQQANPALTWDELLEGEPLWIEWASEGEENLDIKTADCINKRWCFIYRFLGKDKQIIEVLDCNSNWHQFYEENLGTSWNAYRKERA